MRAANYHDFYLHLYNNLHNVLPNGIRGDFYSFTAQYGRNSPVTALQSRTCVIYLFAGADPISFIHHSQLDRLWFHWQQQHMDTEPMDYYEADVDSSDDGEMIRLAGLGDDVQVLQVIDTQGGGMCYRYH